MRNLNDTLLLECVHEGYCTARSKVGKPDLLAESKAGRIGCYRRNL